MLHTLFALLFLSSCARMVIREVQTGRELKEDEFLSSLPDEGTIVLGEQHYSPAIQKAQAKLISKVVKAKEAQGEFTVGWEFLNYPNQNQICSAMGEWSQGQTNETALLLALFGNEAAAKRHQSYLPILRVVRDYDGELRGVNAPREWKRIITSQGIEKLTEEQRPYHCPSPSKNYFERFQKSMQTHPLDHPVERYFAAQYYTDCIMAQSLNSAAYHLRFLITGSFHADYNDGVVPLLEKAVHIRFLSAEQASLQKENDTPIADYLYIIP